MTKPITQLTDHTKAYQNAKGLEDKQRVEKDIKNDSIFTNTKLKIEKEKFEKGEYDVKIENERS